jgi:hypothetical protein
LNLTNFFSFFTVESNILAVIAFIGGALIIQSGKRSERFDFFRGAVTLYMVITGIVFSILLSGLEGVQLTAVPWDNTVLHYLIPVAIVIDWIMDPPAKRVPFKRALWWLVFPLAYFAYSLIRGPIVGWYPYPFLNPAHGGYGKVAVVAVVITLGVLLLTFAITRLSDSRKKRR